MLIYQEFDTTAGTLVQDVITKVLTHTSWSEVTPATLPSVTLTVAAASNATSLTVASTTGLLVGQRLKIVVAGVTYIRVITSITSATVFVINSTTGVAMSIGQVISLDMRVLKCTTTRGADMIVDLQSGDPAAETYRMNMRWWQSWPASYLSVNQLQVIDRYLYWRTSGGVTTQTLHVVLSVSKEHIFLSVEGPRAYETGTLNASYGSLRNYFFMSDVVPYHVTDANPCIVAGANIAATATASALAGSFTADCSKSADGATLWAGSRLATLTFPTIASGETVLLQPDCTIDNATYLWPYVVVGNVEGLRGRLSRFFFAGHNSPTYPVDSSAPVGERITFDGIVYKLHQANKSDSSVPTWGQFGAAANNAGGLASGRSVIIAVPFAEAI